MAALQKVIHSSSYDGMGKKPYLETSSQSHFTLTPLMGFGTFEKMSTFFLPSLPMSQTVWIFNPS